MGPSTTLTAADLLAAKRRIETATPRPLPWAIRCHPADRTALRCYGCLPSRNDYPLGHFLGVAIFADQRQPRGTIALAPDKATYDRWRLDEWRRYLIDLLWTRAHRES